MAVKSGKSYANVEELLRGEFSEEPKIAESFMETFGKEQIANMLWMLRTHHGVTQADMAGRLGISQSAVAKLEDRGDSVKFNDALAYAKALGYSLSLQFTENETTIAGMIRWHLEAVAALMAELDRLADDDEDISLGAFQHFANETAKMLHEVLPQWAGKLSKLKLHTPSAVRASSRQFFADLHAADKSSLVKTKFE